MTESVHGLLLQLLSIHLNSRKPRRLSAWPSTDSKFHRPLSHQRNGDQLRSEVSSKTATNFVQKYPVLAFYQLISTLYTPEY